MTTCPIHDCPMMLVTFHGERKLACPKCEAKAAFRKTQQPPSDPETLDLRPDTPEAK